jgi:small multidrug resistance family-3 protein
MQSLPRHARRILGGDKMLQQALNAPAAAPSTVIAQVAPVASAAGTKGVIQWTAAKVVASIAIFIFAGLAEIGGGWLVWQAVREKRPWYYIVTGFVVLAAYGLIPTLQPEGASFARVYAVYGGVFVVMSYGWGWAVDGNRPDIGDCIGAAIVFGGVALCWFWPRGGGDGSSSSSGSIGGAPTAGLVAAAVPPPLPQPHPPSPPPLHA